MLHEVAVVRTHKFVFPMMQLGQGDRGIRGRRRLSFQRHGCIKPSEIGRERVMFVDTNWAIISARKGAVQLCTHGDFVGKAPPRVVVFGAGALEE